MIFRLSLFCQLSLDQRYLVGRQYELALPAKQRRIRMNQMSISKQTIWTGRVLSGLAILFLLFDGIMKFFMDKLPPEALEAGAALQWPIEKMPLVGTILLICTLLYIVP